MSHNNDSTNGEVGGMTTQSNSQHDKNYDVLPIQQFFNDQLQGKHLRIHHDICLTRITDTIKKAQCRKYSQFHRI